jgi:hypothetical protein
MSFRIRAASKDPRAQGKHLPHMRSFRKALTKKKAFWTGQEKFAAS